MLILDLNSKFRNLLNLNIHNLTLVPHKISPTELCYPWVVTPLGNDLGSTQVSVPASRYPVPFFLVQRAVVVGIHNTFVQTLVCTVDVSHILNDLARRECRLKFDVRNTFLSIISDVEFVPQHSGGRCRVCARLSTSHWIPRRHR